MRRYAKGLAPKLSRQAQIIRLVVLVCGVALVLATLYAIGRRIEASTYTETTVRGDLSERFAQEQTIVLDGVTYAARKGIQTFLFMGIDRGEGDQAEIKFFRNAGQADFMQLVIIDSENRTVKQWQIDRDTMVEITVLGVMGHVSGTRYAQICLSHSFGDGKAQSCELAAEAVQRLLYGVPIDFYAAIPFDAVGLLNDAVGGVTVTIEDDFTQIDPRMAPGTTLTLTAEQAETFVRSRMQIGDGLNVSRMRRQRAFMLGLADQFDTMVSQSANTIGTLFDTMGDVMVTNLKRGRMINEANKAMRYTREPMRTLEGEHRVNEDGFMEFHVDEEALQQLVLETFYTPRQ